MTALSLLGLCDRQVVEHLPPLCIHRLLSGGHVGLRRRRLLGPPSRCSHLLVGALQCHVRTRPLAVSCPLVALRSRLASRRLPLLRGSPLFPGYRRSDDSLGVLQLLRGAVPDLLASRILV